MTGTNYVVAGVVAAACAIGGGRTSPSFAISCGGIGQSALCALLSLPALAEGNVVAGALLGVALFAFLLGRLSPRRFLPAGAALQFVAMLFVMESAFGALGFLAFVTAPSVALAALPWLAPPGTIPGSRRRPTTRPA